MLLSLGIKNEDVPDDENKKVHPWRKCSVGKHFVREHVVHVPPSKKHPDGKVSLWREYCAKNPSHKDELTTAEIKYITKTYFAELEGAPAAGVLKEFRNADKFDKEIRGWVRYWNDIFNPTELLDANLIKALIASESSFHKKPKKKNGANGLMQLMNLTFRILQNIKGELRDHLVRMTKEDLFYPSVNICAGVRWLFWKRVTASVTLKRTATWEEAIIEYKDYWEEVNAGKTPKNLSRLRVFYNRLQEKSI